jgi:hypothetical protein
LKGSGLVFKVRNTCSRFGWWLYLVSCIDLITGIFLVTPGYARDWVLWRSKGELNIAEWWHDACFYM